MAIDDFLRAIEEDERNDKADILLNLTPIEYGRLRDIVPQRIYAHVRKHRGHETCDNHLSLEPCLCGRKVLNVKAADEYFGVKVPERDEALHEQLQQDSEEDFIEQKREEASGMTEEALDAEALEDAEIEEEEG